jgi:uncharacterized membrane protein
MDNRIFKGGGHMSLFLRLAYLFFLGSLFGWVLELLFRKFFSSSNPEHRWINPGFCVGPYLPLYGSGLCALYCIATLAGRFGFGGSVWSHVLVIAIITVSMTALEYLSGVLMLKVVKVRLWDYTDCWGNIQGLICPLFTFFWGLLGAAYLYLIHPYILDALRWLSENLAFSFVIGYFFGVFTLEVAYSAHLAARVKRFAEENGVIVRYEALKAHIQSVRSEAKQRIHFFFALRSELPLAEHLRSAAGALETIKRRL